jgi:hypothetical protein
LKDNQNTKKDEITNIRLNQGDFTNTNNGGDNGRGGCCG